MSMLDTLPLSPPTTSHRHRVPFSHLSKPATSTPDDSPASGLPSSSENGSRKRVEFSPWTNILEGTTFDKPSDGSALKPLPRSKDCQSVSKSILKPQSDQQSSLPPRSISAEASTVPMDSLAQALGNNDKITSLDAYQSLAQLIKTYNEVPDDSDTRGNIAAIVRSIRRDLASQDQGSSSPIDINLVTQALKVTVILVWSEHFCPLLPEDFKVYITDRAIGILTEHTAPKVVIIHYMHVLATQSFRAAVFSSGNRTVKLLEALREITNHVQGKGTMAERLLIYQKLIEQAKSIMKAKAGLWMKEVLLGLCSTVREIRDKAISVCSKAVAAFSISSAISQAAREALSEESKDRTLSANLTQRLDRMIAAKDEAVQVPQIWALVMLLCSSSESRIDSWSLVRDWLRVIQRCFNCSDINVRVQAFPAWNRFIYIIKPHEASEAMMSMLAKPIAVQIERTGANASSKGSRPAAVSSYCTLLYYAFRPAATHKQYTKAWNEYVVKIATSQFLSKSTANADLCCRVLMALFWKDGSVSRIWNEARALENKPMDPEELPAIDCKWTRAKAGAVLEIFQLLFRYSAWGPSILHSDQAFVAKAWRAFLKALRESTSKEIKPSAETKKALQTIVAFINEVRNGGDVSNINLSRAQLACKIAISELGGLTMFESLDAKESWQQPNIVFSEILMRVTNSLSANIGQDGKDDLKGMTPHSEGIIPNLLQRSLGVLNDQINLQYRTEQPAKGMLSNLLDLCAKTLQRIPASHKFRCLHCLQSSISTVMKDGGRIGSTEPANSEFVIAMRRLTSSVIEGIRSVEPSRYAELDLLLTSMLSSTNVSITNDLLQWWSSVEWPVTEGCYGTQLAAAVKELQEKVDVSLPTLVQGDKHMNDRSQVQHTIFEAVSPVNDNESAVESLEISIEQLRRNSPPTTLVTNEAEKKRTDAVTKCNISSPRKRRKHDESQLDFTLIDSSPTKLDELDSQLLTDRQKEVRTRQRAEQAVTFADLRSSPISMANRTSRATSVDCEMARKIAASEYLPTTPTLLRHTGAMDDEEMPSPTPKARHHTSGIVDIEVVSSPPSTTVNRNIDFDTVGQVSTILNAAICEDAGIINLDQMQADATIFQPDVCIESPKQKRILRSSNKLQVHDPQIDDPQQEIANEMVVMKDNNKMVDLDGSKSQQSEGYRVEVNNVDDNAAASQQAETTGLARKRKRTVSNYAEISGQPTRKRPSTGKRSSEPGCVSHVPTSEQNEIPAHSKGNHVGQLPIEQDHGIVNLEEDEVSGPKESQTSSILSSSKRQSGRARKSRRSSRHARNSQNYVRDGTREGLEEQHSMAVLYDKPGPDIGTRSSKPDLEDERKEMEIVDTAQQDGKMSPPKGHIDIMKALETALTGLEHSEMAQKVDLKAIDDLCFKIRFKAQEIVQKKTHL